MEMTTSLRIMTSIVTLVQMVASLETVMMVAARGMAAPARVTGARAAPHTRAMASSVRPLLAAAPVARATEVMRVWMRESGG